MDRTTEERIEDAIESLRSEELAAMLRAVEGIADGIGNVAKLAIELAPGRSPAMVTCLLPGERAALDGIEAALINAVVTDQEVVHLNAQDAAIVYRLAMDAIVRRR